MPDDPVTPSSRRAAFAVGLAVGFLGITGFVMFSTALGFGALARDLGFTLAHAMFMGLAVYALPGQVVLVDELARGTGLVATALAVSLTGVRMLPMTVTLVPLLRGEARIGPLHVLAVHFVSVTSWIEGHQRLPGLAPHLRLAMFLGMGASFVTLLVAGSMAGFVLAGRLPTIVSAALLLMTPLYFITSMLAGVKRATDVLPVVFGALLGPLLFRALPGFDLAVTGLLGGTAAWAIERRLRR